MIEKYKDNPNTTIQEQLKSAYTNLLEALIISNKDFQYILSDIDSRYKDDKNTMLKKDMIILIAKAKDSDVKVDINRFRDRYKDTDLGGFGFGELQTWADTLDDDAKDRVLSAINQFEEFFKK